MRKECECLLTHLIDLLLRLHREAIEHNFYQIASAYTVSLRFVSIKSLSNRSPPVFSRGIKFLKGNTGVVRKTIFQKSNIFYEYFLH